MDTWLLILLEVVFLVALAAAVVGSGAVTTAVVERVALVARRR